MQCILTSSSLAAYFNGEVIHGDHAMSFICPYCGIAGFEETELLPHLESKHTEPCNFWVWCPICVTLDGRDTAMTENLLEHVVHEHDATVEVIPNPANRDPRTPASTFRAHPVQRINRIRPRGGIYRSNLTGSLSSSSQDQPRRPAAPGPTFAMHSGMPPLESSAPASVIPPPIPSAFANPGSPPMSTSTWRERLARNLEAMEGVGSSGRGFTLNVPADGGSAAGGGPNARLRSIWMDSLRGGDIQSAPPPPKESVTFSPTVTAVAAKEEKKSSEVASFVTRLLKDSERVPEPFGCSKRKNKLANERLFMQEVLLATTHEGFLPNLSDALNEPVSYDNLMVPDFDCSVSLVSSNMSISDDSDGEECPPVPRSPRMRVSTGPAIVRAALSDTFLFHLS
ncbi:hypothetical protein BV898_12719 [Hypsibius exemplaris]|uniref:Di19 zinc-binding domain-containing protein n=1 Tax=Hypsibius exemplaris TaxID=2072580 RepID=A0A1W0WD19_HYPEX|nr:hypothetical protein BV898_12719 [Hypsibius exemplaris]